MLYRNLGNSGIKVSVFGFGNWVSSKTEEGCEKHYNMVKFMFEKGCNFFDTAESYDFGLGERNLGKALNRLRKEVGAQRSDYVLTTKLFVGSFPEDKLHINNMGTSRKHLIEGLERSLKNLEHDYIDVLFCHRYDKDTSTEEVVLTMKSLIESNKILYWGTSEWPSARIMEAIHLADKFGCPRPIVEQCQYNLLVRKKMEDDYSPLFEDYKYGSTVWSPLASGLLTGKYNDGIPPDSRLAQNKNLMGLILSSKGIKSLDELVILLKKLEVVAKKLNTTLPLLSLAWVIKYNYTSTCILGASKLEQLEENIKALDLINKIDETVENEIDLIFNNVPSWGFDFKKFKEYDGFRKEKLYLS